MPKFPLWLNPKNWGVEDFSAEKSFKKAYAKARTKGLQEFIFNNERYNTDYNGTSNEQFKKYGNTNKSINANVSDSDNTRQVLKHLARSGKNGKSPGESLDRLYEIHERVGNPSVELDPGIDRSHYNAITNTMKIQRYGDYADEASHAAQSNVIFRSISDWFKDPYISSDGYERQYDRKGSVEYNAHKVIEPYIRDLMDGSTNLKKDKKTIFNSGGMAKFKYLRGGRVFESDKAYNLPQIGQDGKLLTPKKTTTPDKPLKNLSTDEPWNNPERQWYGGSTNLGKGEDLYIDDSGNLAKKPVKKITKKPLEIPTKPILPDATSNVNTKMQAIIAGPKPVVGKPVFNDGGFIQRKKPVRQGLQAAVEGMFKQTESNPGLPTAGTSPTTPAAPQATSMMNSKKSFGDILGSTAPFLDNVANLIATKNTPSVPSPTYTAPPRMQTKINIDPQIKKINEDVATTSRAIDQGTSSAGVANANKAKLVADKWRATGELQGNKVNAEAQLTNQAAYADYQGRRSNDALSNQRNQMDMMRTDDVNSRYAGVLSDFGSDIANINREKNLMARDKDAMRMLMKTNPDAIYQFADTATFEELYRDNEPELRKLILTQRGSEQKAKLSALYKKLFNRDI